MGRERERARESERETDIHGGMRGDTHIDTRADAHIHTRTDMHTDTPLDACTHTHTHTHTHEWTRYVASLPEHVPIPSMWSHELLSHELAGSYIYVDAYMCIYVGIDIDMHIYVYRYMYVYIYTCIHVFALSEHVPISSTWSHEL